MADDTRKQAVALIRYLQFRAEKEGVACGLTADQIESWMRQGAAMMFGITYDGGMLTGDEQQPELFEQWTANSMKQH
jgi:hypothetical protein